jgi:hypothetical protein
MLDLRNKLLAFGIHIQRIFYSSPGVSLLSVSIITLALLIILPTINTQPEIKRNSISESSKTRLLKLDNLIIRIPESLTYPNLKINLTLEPHTYISRSLEGVSLVYNFKANTFSGLEYKEFNGNFFVTINYTSNSVENINENTIAIYYSKDGSENWVKLPTTLDMNNKIATAESSLTGKYTLMGNINYAPQPIGYTKKEYPLSEWKEYENKQFSFKIYYPPNWDIYIPEKPSDSNNQIMSIYAIGDVQGSQKIETELFDGVSLDISIPTQTDKDLDSWVKEWVNDNYKDDLKYGYIDDYSQEIINNQRFYKIELCGGQCNTHYITESGDNIYIINIFSAGPDMNFFLNKSEEIVHTFDFLN